MKKRFIYDSILNQRNNKKASIILGPRQVGKTTILKELHRQLKGLFFDIDIFSQYEQIATYENFIATLTVNGYNAKNNEFFYVFLDEFQRYPNLAMVIKSVYDHHNNIKIFASGSSSIGIKNSIQESLAGRKIITYLYPLSFREFLIFKEREDILKKIDNLILISDTDDYFKLVPETLPLLNDFLVFGGYPEVALSPASEKKKLALESIFDLYIKKDFAEYINVEKIRNASQLIRQIAINNGSITNYSEYAAAIGIDVKTVKNYLAILEETFILTELKPYFTNKTKEIIKLPKLYFIDNGVRNYFANNFSDIDLRADAGFLFESFYIAELIKNGETISNLKYYRTKSGDEIDIIIDQTPKLIPIEIKYKKKLKLRDFSAIKRFIKKYSAERGYIASIGEIGKEENIYKIDCFRKIT